MALAEVWRGKVLLFISTFSVPGKVWKCIFKIIIMDCTDVHINECFKLNSEIALERKVIATLKERFLWMRSWVWKSIFTHMLKGHVSMVIKDIIYTLLVYLQYVGNWCSWQFSQPEKNGSIKRPCRTGVEIRASPKVSVSVGRLGVWI